MSFKHSERYKNIGIKISKYRLKRGLTQEDLAEQIDISVAFLSRVERGNAHINLKRLNQLCGLLDVSEGYLLKAFTETASDMLKTADKKQMDYIIDFVQKHPDNKDISIIKHDTIENILNYIK